MHGFVKCLFKFMKQSQWRPRRQAKHWWKCEQIQQKLNLAGNWKFGENSWDLLIKGNLPKKLAQNYILVSSNLAEKNPRKFSSIWQTTVTNTSFSGISRPHPPPPPPPTSCRKDLEFDKNKDNLSQIVNRGNSMWNVFLLWHSITYLSLA